MNLPSTPPSHSAEVVVVGSGLAGTVAALRAQESGRRTLLLDQCDEPGGQSNTVLSQGVLHICSRSVLAPDTELEAAITARTGGFGDAAVTQSMLGYRREAMAWLGGHGVRTEPVDTGEAQLTGFAPFVPLPHVDAWRQRGPDVALQALRTRFASLGGTVFGATTALELIESTTRPGVSGVVVRHSGRLERVGAGTVVLADGGFQANPQMLSTYIGRFADRCKLRAAPTGTGDGIRMAEAVRARLINLQYFYGHLLHRDALISDALWPHPRVDPLLDVGILVTSEGRRFVDEGLGGVAAANATARLDDPRGVWVVTDEDGWQAARRAPRSFDTFEDVGTEIAHRGGHIVHEADLVALARATGLPAEELKRTVDEHNRSGSTVARTGAPVAVARGPFHAVPVVAGITFTLGGIAIDRVTRAIDLDGRPIPGLHAVGGTIGGLSGGPRGGYVGGLLPALVTGFVAGTCAASPVDVA